MATIYFSFQAKGFFRSDIHGIAIPPDAVEITPELHQSLLQALSNGKVIVANASGTPVAADPPPATAEQIAATRKHEIVARLALIDLLSLRPMRAIYSGTDSETDHQTLADLEGEAINLRAELASLTI